MSSSYEGKQDSIPELATPRLETFNNVYQGKIFTVKLSISEFTALCPKTSLPDFGSILIEYQPDKQCIELKSLKNYIHFYRDIGIFS